MHAAILILLAFSTLCACVTLAFGAAGTVVLTLSVLAGLAALGCFRAAEGALR